MIQLCARAHNLDETETILAQGFEFLEISLPCPGGREEERAWQTLAKERNLTFLGHGPNEGDPRDLAHLSQKTLPQFRQALEAASRLGASLLTIHFNLDTRWISPETITGKIDLLGRIVDWGSELAVQVNLENLSETAADLESALLRLPKLGLTLDVGHAMLSHRISTAPDIIAQLFDRISHLHLHDNQGGKSPRDDLHLVPGEGKVDFSRILLALSKSGYNRTATLEVAPQDLALARTRVTDLWKQASS
jgi:sugar phosphate isomerase/epimerase